MSIAKFEYIVTEQDQGLPIKGLLRREFHFSTRLMNKLKSHDCVSLNGIFVKLHIVPQAGDLIKVKMPTEKSDFIPENIPISIVYEDDSLLIINKQPGFVVHPTKGHPNRTIANGIMKYLMDQGKSFKIRFVNRLDMDTSGLLVVAKNSHSQDDFSKQMAQNKVVKRYVAIVNGHLDEGEGVINLPIGKAEEDKVNRVVREDGLPSITHYKVIERYTHRGLNRAGALIENKYTQVELVLETGRTHQIRVHMSYMGHPVVGDELYGGANPVLIERQALHAKYLSFKHPVTGEHMEVFASLPEDMIALIEKIRG
ncbi:MAG: RluA family pseudouridine synthase [Anaerovorax sp.]